METEKDITLRRSVASACASAARALDAGVDSETEHAEDAKDGKSVSFAAEARALEWRVVYSFRGETDHGAVENSPGALVADAPVIEAELENAKRALGWSSN